MIWGYGHSAMLLLMALAHMLWGGRCDFIWSDIKCSYARTMFHKALTLCKTHLNMSYLYPCVQKDLLGTAKTMWKYFRVEK